jgi:hypothetical protein
MTDEIVAGEELVVGNGEVVNGDRSDGRPFGVAQGKPFDVAQGKSFGVAQGKSFDVAH